MNFLRKILNNFRAKERRVKELQALVRGYPNEEPNFEKIAQELVRGLAQRGAFDEVAPEVIDEIWRDYVGRIESIFQSSVLQEIQRLELVDELNLVLDSSIPFAQYLHYAIPDYSVFLRKTLAKAQESMRIGNPDWTSVESISEQSTEPEDQPHEGALKTPPLAQTSHRLTTGRRWAKTAIFLSYNHTDRDFARKLRTALEANGVEVWLDEHQIAAGDSLLYRVQSAIDSVKYLGVILSPDSVRSKWVQLELEMAMTQQLSAGKLTVLPILYKHCEVPLFLQGKLWVDFTTPLEFSRAVNKVVDAVYPQRLGNQLTAKEALRNIQASFNPPGDLCAISQKGVYSHWVSKPVLRSGDWLAGGLSHGRSRIWVAEFLGATPAMKVQSFGLLDGRADRLASQDFNSFALEPVHGVFHDSDTSQAAALIYARENGLILDQRNLAITARLHHPKQLGLRWFFTFEDLALRKALFVLGVDARNTAVVLELRPEEDLAGIPTESTISVPVAK